MSAIPASLVLFVSKLWRAASSGGGQPDGLGAILRPPEPVGPSQHDALRRAAERWGRAAVYDRAAAPAVRGR
jgi:hypothetical protein